MLETTGTRAAASALAHLGGHIDADRLTGRTHSSRGEQQVGAGAASDVEYARAGRNRSNRVRIADSGERARHVGRQSLELGRVVAEPLNGVLWSAMKVKGILRRERHTRIHRLHLAAQPDAVEINRAGDGHDVLRH